MGRLRRRDKGDAIIDMVKFGVLGIVLLVLATSGVQGLAAVPGILITIGIIAIGAIVVAILFLLGIKLWRKRTVEELMGPALAPSAANAGNGAKPISGTVVTRPKPLDEVQIREMLLRFDWFQFERLNAALLSAGGFSVELRGGAHPGGGVDLITFSQEDGARRLVQCKHWIKWKVNEKTVREMLGAMTHFGVKSGEIRVMSGWTAPAAQLAVRHGIALVDGHAIAKAARAALSDEQLVTLLNPSTKHCPKCESAMALKTGNFDPFWGCSRFPRCRGVIKVHTGESYE